MKFEVSSTGRSHSTRATWAGSEGTFTPNKPNLDPGKNAVIAVGERGCERRADGATVENKPDLFWGTACLQQ